MTHKITGTYRLQLNYQFNLKKAQHILKYLKLLGISDLYLSPLIKAKWHSLHGYDITDPNKINEEIAQFKSLRQFVSRLKLLNLKAILDIVPNHMSATFENKWWKDVLAKERASPFATLFDIDWEKKGKLFYRRFFDINELVCVNVDNEAVFHVTHNLLKKFLKKHWISGVRVDHIDGVRAPDDYLEYLNQLLGEKNIWVEKILKFAEALPTNWEVVGTTGYDFLNMNNALFINPAGCKKIIIHYDHLIKNKQTLDQIRYASNKYVIYHLFGRELNHLATLFEKCLNAIGINAEINLLKNLITEMTARMPVYRTYIKQDLINEKDQHILNHILQIIKKDGKLISQELHLLKLVFKPRVKMRQSLSWQRFISTWQVFTAPVIAKGYEDTTCYRYLPLLSLNEVGSSPQYFKIKNPLAEFHAYQFNKYLFASKSLNTTSTHDTKRSEDIRARLNVLSEIPDEWVRRVKKWRHLNKHLKRFSGSVEIPSVKEEYYIYQTLLASWPLTKAGWQNYQKRIYLHLQKALREAKENTTWKKPVLMYERATLKFCKAILNNPAFLQSFLKLQNVVAYFGMLNSLTQLLLKNMTPGIPDYYQGNELWQFKLVDPDNRRQINFAKREKALKQLIAMEKHYTSPMLYTVLMKKWTNGLIKMNLMRNLLHLRERHPQFFLEGSYQPIQVEGSLKKHVIAFTRSWRHHKILVIAVIHPYRVYQSMEITDFGLPFRDEFIHLPKVKTLTAFFTRRVTRVLNHQLKLSTALHVLPFNVFFLS